MNIYLLLALAVLANVGALVAIALWYRRDRAQLLTDKREWKNVARDARADLLETRGDLAEAQGELAGWKRKNGELAQARADLAIRLDNTRAELREKTRACAVETERWDRLYALPTLDGIRADSRDNPPDAVALATEFRRDFDAAQVVPIRGAKR